ncbi:o-succinylbenzoate synthase [uncultured Anoxybacillus sp.]|uniref:o-succinylbenzoate synthase n=1 Tax=uncultured Anoxybacillus sp. TaxID=263860 RepID=UPI0026324925|nr:o-succinylbenzoate synthase [uncultured Anoxybacillus sp.]
MYVQINTVILRYLEIELKSPFTTSFGTMKKRPVLLVEVMDEHGVRGWGEGVAFAAPWYTEETIETMWHMLEAFLIPLLFQAPVHHPDELRERFSIVRRNYMAKAALEGAVWDLFAKRRHIPLHVALGGEKKEVDVGVSIGIQPITDLLKRMEQALIEGYRRVKIKIKPGWDVDVVRAVRHHFPDIPLMVDANSAYSLRDIDRLQALDDYELLMIEQPLAVDDIVDHAKLQAKLKTPICLDESICSYEDAKRAIELKSCRVINIKIGRVGGLTEAKRIHDLCQQHDLPVWCGGMLEGGVGRAHSIALATLPHFSLPSDTAASANYWDRDFITPEVTVRDGRIFVRHESGIGYEVDVPEVEKRTVRSKICKRSRG